MDVDEREEFRQYLVKTGVVKALSRVLLRLYELKYNRPDAALAFIIKSLIDELPSFTEYGILLNELNATKTVLEVLKKNGNLSASELAMINNIQLSMENSSENKALSAGQLPEEYINKMSIAGQGSVSDGSLISARQSQIMKGNRSKTSSDNSKFRKNLKTDRLISKEIMSIMDNVNCSSLLKKHLDIDLYNKLKDEKTSFGATLVDCICSGLEIHESKVGVYAFDAEAYDKFADLFDPLIEDYHGFKKNDTHPTIEWGDPNTFTNLDPSNEFITSTRIRCIRTVEKFSLIPSMTEKNFQALCAKLKNVLEQLSGDVSGTFYELDKLDAETKTDMINNRYILEYGDRFLEAAGATKFWPTGRAVFLNENKTFFTWVNEEDHLRFISMEPGSDICSVYSRLINAVEQCSKNLTFSKHPRFGYLAFCPSNLGNTIRASVMIKIPKLAKAKENKLEEVAKKYKLEIRGQGNGSGEMFEISNKRKLGLTEYESIKELYVGLKEIIEMEKLL